MHPDSKDYLAAGARATETVPRHEAAERAAASRDSVLLDLSAARGLLRASGADAATFLNGQLTNDILGLPSGRSRLAGYCTPQGRLLAIARVFRRGADYWLEVPLELRDDLLARLRKYVLRAKVALEPADPDLVLFGLAGPRAAEMLARAIGAPPPGEGETLESGDLTALRIAGPRDRFELVAPVGTAKTLWSILRTEGARTVASDWWEWFHIEAGIPEVYRATQEKFVPQTANLEIVGGVSFDKGCYPGQEIVARVHYLGRLKERMYRLHLPGDAAPQPGDPVYAPDLPGQTTGTVVRAHAAPGGGFDLLAVVHASSAAAGELHWRSPDGPRLVASALPYAVTSSQS